MDIELLESQEEGGSKSFLEQDETAKCIVATVPCLCPTCTSGAAWCLGANTSLVLITCGFYGLYAVIASLLVITPTKDIIQPVKEWGGKLLKWFSQEQKHGVNYNALPVPFDSTSEECMPLELEIIQSVPKGRTGHGTFSIN